MEEYNYSENQNIIGFTLKEHHVNKLDLSGALFEQVPEIISKLTCLQTLILDDNNIKEIPDFIYKLTSLKNLSLKGNKINCIPGRLSGINVII